MRKTQKEYRDKFKKKHPDYWKEYYRKNPKRYEKYYVAGTGYIRKDKEKSRLMLVKKFLKNFCKILRLTP